MKLVGYMFGRRKSTPPVFILQKKIGYMPRENGPVWSKDIYMFVRRKSTTRPFVNKSNGDFLGTNRIFPLQDQTFIREVANIDTLYFCYGHRGRIWMFICLISISRGTRLSSLPRKQDS